MATKRKRRRKPKVKPPLGPAVNLRPAGAHKTQKRYDRKRNQEIVAAEAEEQE